MIAAVISQGDLQLFLLLQCLRRFNDELFDIILTALKKQGFTQIVLVAFDEGFANAFGQAVVKVRNALTAMLIVLVGLNGNTGKSGIAGNIVRLAQLAVAGGKTALEQALDIDLAASGS